jgi:hypothetical protein
MVGMKTTQIGFAILLGSVAGFMVVTVGGLMIGNTFAFIDKGTFISWAKYAQVLPMLLRAGCIGAIGGAIEGMLWLGDIA